MIYSKAVITSVAVAAILILGTLTNSQVLGTSHHKSHHHKGYYHKGNHGYKHTRYGNLETVNNGESGYNVNPGYTVNPPFENPPHENPPFENPPHENPSFENPP